MMKINHNFFIITTKKFNTIIFLYTLFILLSFFILYKYKLNTITISIFILLDLYFSYHLLWNFNGKYKLFFYKDFLIVEKVLFFSLSKTKIYYKNIKNIFKMENINSGYHLSFSGIRIQLNFDYMINLFGDKFDFKFESGNEILTNTIYKKIKKKLRC